MSYENDLSHEFPQFKERMHELKILDAHFRRLYDAYEALGKELHRISQQVETPDDAYVESCKKTRLQLKDELFALLKAVAV